MGTYRVVNLTTGETRAELQELIHAIVLAEDLAKLADYNEVYAVIEFVTVHETRTKSKPSNL